ncbi:MAG: GNAT family N-acetyltransferase [Chitinophagaceae bacterium]|jgi:ribosomal protein S18 acetylase RimI-like enzyme|nr:GNAT family N-acetyltransferase [Chitinophagaceae bacterium]
MSSVQLKDVGLDLAELIADISRKTFQETFGPVNTEADMQLFLQKQFTTDTLIKEVGIPGNRHVLAYVDGIPAGYLFLKYHAHALLLNDPALEISRIYCLEKFQGKGVGKSLMQEAIMDANRKKLKWVWLGVWKENAKAISFYRSFGFNTFGTTDFLLGNDWQEDWLMARKC